MGKIQKKDGDTPKKNGTSSLRISDYAEYVSRKQAYDDSTSTYKDSIKNHNRLIALGMEKTGSSKPKKEDLDKLLKDDKINKKYTHEFGDSSNPIKKTTTVQQKTSSKIAPRKINNYVGKPLVDEDGVSYQNEIQLPIYTKPKQEVVYEPDDLSRPPVDLPLDEVKETVKKKSITERTVGGDYKKVPSKNPKYSGNREYSKFEKNEGEIVEDQFKKSTLERRNRVLNKSTAKVTPKNTKT